MAWERWNRREFLAFWGKGAGAVAVTSLFSPLLAQCVNPATSDSKATEEEIKPAPPSPFLEPTTEDEIVTVPGLVYDVLLSWGDSLGGNGETFGFNNDYLGVIPIPGTDELWLWVNHETPHPLFVSGWDGQGARTRAQVVREQESVGGSIVPLKRQEDGRWLPLSQDARCRRLSARTRIPFSGKRLVKGKRAATGTLGNCAGGVTPWGTFLTCEENYSDFYGERGADDKTLTPSRLGWEDFFPEPPEHFGWVVEVEPATGQAKKHVALGRFAHEGATVALGKGGIPVVYMGDDGDDRCFYKFIGDKPHSLESGTLFVARCDVGVWEPLTLDHPKLKDRFKNHTDLMVRAREAAQHVGGTPFDRPEGAVFDAGLGAVFVSLTNNFSKGRPYGQIGKFAEENKDPLSRTFRFSSLAMGGPEAGFACPDNLALDRKGNLWFTSDMSEWEARPGGPYEGFGNNSLFYMPLTGENAGKASRVVSAPNDAELTGPCFAPDGKTLFLSVQHPGSRTKDVKAPTSRWNLGNDDLPRPAVIALRGPFLERLTLS